MPTNSPTPEKVQITLTVEQADVVKRALDLYTRLHLGQIEIIGEMVRDQSIPTSPNNAYLSAHHPDYAEIDAYCADIKGVLGFSRGENLGISNPKVSLSALRAHEIWAVLAKTLAEQNPSPHGYVERDGLILRYTKDAVPVAVLAQDN